MVTKWFGTEIAGKVTEAAMVSVNELTEQAAREARSDHWWNRRSGNLGRQTVNERARISRGAVSGKFGSTRRQGFYGLFLELREPWLRPVADRVFPELPYRMAERLRELP